MTKPRSVTTVEGAIARAIGLLTVEGVADAVGKSPRLVHAWSDPDDDTHRPSIFQAMQIDAALVAEGHDAAILTVYAHRVGGRRAHAALPPEERLMVAMKEVGDVAEALRLAARPGSPGGREIAPIERMNIEMQTAEAIEALQALLRDLDNLPNVLKAG